LIAGRVSATRSSENGRSAMREKGALYVRQINSRVAGGGAEEGPRENTGGLECAIISGAARAQKKRNSIFLAIPYPNSYFIRWICLCSSGDKEAAHRSPRFRLIGSQGSFIERAESKVTVWHSPHDL
jgi:hypothetical protein